MPQNGYSTSSSTKARTKKPEHYNVIMHNDDFTTMDFVVDILKKVFFKSHEDAIQLMLDVHHEGKAVVGCYTFDVAASKAAKAMSIAREEGFPFRLTVEPQELPF